MALLIGVGAGEHAPGSVVHFFGIKLNPAQRGNDSGPDKLRQQHNSNDVITVDFTDVHHYELDSDGVAAANADTAPSCAHSSHDDDSFPAGGAHTVHGGDTLPSAETHNTADDTTNQSAAGAGCSSSCSASNSHAPVSATGSVRRATASEVVGRGFLSLVNHQDGTVSGGLSLYSGFEQLLNTAQVGLWHKLLGSSTSTGHHAQYSGRTRSMLVLMQYSAWLIAVGSLYKHHTLMMITCIG